jgi:hypothetical protein
MLRQRLAREESGIALVLALITMAVLGSLTASVTFAVVANQRGARTSGNAAQAFALAEAGLAQAEGLLYASPMPHDANNVPPTGPVSLDGGTYSYSGTLSGNTWTLTATGTMNGISRTVTAKATVPDAIISKDPTIWNYIYADNPNACVTITGSVTVNVPIYTQGGFCLSGSAKYTGSDLEVGGNVSVTNTALIGKDSGHRIGKMNVVGTCTPAPCDGSHNPIWVNSPGVGHTLDPVVTKPTIDLAATYATTNPGPATGHACQTGSGVPSPFFDNDTTLNNSVSSVNLVPSGQSYDCIIGSNEIKWDGSSKLTVNGTFYFDGNLSLNGSQKIIYKGIGTLFFTGTVKFTSSEKFCGDKDCTAGWDTSKNVVAFVAGCWSNSTGSTLVKYATTGSYCFDIAGSNNVQIPVYAVTDYHISGSATNMGPAIADTVTMQGNATTLLPLHTLPSDAPAVIGAVYPQASAPTNWSG